MHTSQVISIIGALGIGSVVGQWVANSKDRRQTRADALKALTEVEFLRWWSATTETDDKFNQAVRSLPATCVVAGIPRRAVREYLVWAQAAFWVSKETWETEGDTDMGGGSIPSDLADCVQEAAQTLAQIIRMPIWIRYLVVRRLNRLSAPEKTDMLDGRVTKQIKRARRHLTAL